MSDFDLSQFFDLSKKIDKYDREIAEAEIALRAYKDGMNSDGYAVRQCCKEMRQAIKEHNSQFNIK
jgi:hypothetical protein